MELLAHARIVMWEGGALWVVNATDQGSRETQSTDLHAHHAIQVTMGLGGRFRLRTADAYIADAHTGGARTGDAGAAIAPDAAHAFEAEGLIALLFVEPESRAGRAIAAQLFGSTVLAAVPESMVGDFRDRIAAAFLAPVRPADDAFVALGQALIAHMAGGVRAEVPDLRVRKVAAWAAAHLDGPLSLANAATVAGLSQGRLRHLFVEDTGLPFKTYILWLRLTRALERFAAGDSLTQAAHEAGFSDSAHLSRTFRRMFGVAPAGLRMT